MFKEVKYSDLSQEALEQLARGAFLTVKTKDNEMNTMTIGWGGLGYMWGRPIFISMVRYSRYTYELMENANDFTISLPSKDHMKMQLDFCGRASGRDSDKFKDCGLKVKQGDTTMSPVIEDCKLFLECRTVYKQPMLKDNLEKEIRDRWYANDDYHMMYYGEITKVYIHEE